MAENNNKNRLYPDIDNDRPEFESPPQLFQEDSAAAAEEEEESAAQSCPSSYSSHVAFRPEECSSISLASDETNRPETASPASDETNRPETASPASDETNRPETAPPASDETNRLETVPRLESSTSLHEQDGRNEKGGRYFYYDAPLYEETGFWVPVSVPPMSESDHQEWSRGFISNGGYFPEGDIGWEVFAGEDKEMTMWDVVSEMLFKVGGKVNSLTSGDFRSRQLAWLSSQLLDHAWMDMAHTLTEAEVGSSQEIMEMEPPKWLPDSSSATCMLCNVRFHPIMCSRHHCRLCGGLFCSECSRGKSLLPPKFRTVEPQRVCDVCCVRLESAQPYLMNQVSRASQLPTRDVTDLSTLRSWLNFPWGQTMEYEIYKAANIIRGYRKVGALTSEKSIPVSILRQAKGFAILTVAKVGVMVTYNVGTGLVVARRDDGSWSPPSAISSFGIGWGAQMGGELTDFIIVLRNKDAIRTFTSTAHLSFGAGASAAAGIVGRTVEADFRAGDGGYAACYTYSCSKGAFVGCSLKGSVVTTRMSENCRFYGSSSIKASDILLGSIPRPPAAAVLYNALTDLFLKVAT